MASVTNGVFRNYRFILIAVTTLTLILILKSSTPDIKPIETVANQNSGEALRNQPNAAEWVNSDKIKQVDDAKLKGEPPAATMPSPGTNKAEVPLKMADKPHNDSNSNDKGGKCSKENEYIVMIDAGSTGSRVHVYEFNICNKPPSLVNEYFKQLKPGLSSFDSDAEKAAKSLDPLLEFAIEKIPKAKRNCSPVAVKATAGLRLLGETKSNNILNAVKRHLENDFEFPVVKDDGVSIMDGADEGVYAWITTNYLLGNIGGAERASTAAVFDLGGGSTQLVFEPNSLSEVSLISDEARKYELNFDKEKYTLYQVSHLGYGLMESRKKINQLIVQAAIENGDVEKSATSVTHKLDSPCLPPGVIIKNVKVELPSKQVYTVDFQGQKQPAPAHCRSLADKILKKGAPCNKKPCSFNGVHQPSLVKSFSSPNDLYVFSYFYDRTFPLGLPLSYTLQELFDLTRIVCMGKDTWQTALSSVSGAMQSLAEEPNWCMDLTYQAALLHTGYDIPLERELRTAATLEDRELGWCLGASLALLDSANWDCKSPKN